MAFLKGQPKPEGSGRQKGTPNRKTVAKVSDYLGEQGINPAEEILTIINEKKVVTDHITNLQREEFVLGSGARADLWLELLSFCHAKPKSLEIKKADNSEDFPEFDEVPTEDLMNVITKQSKIGTA